MTNDPCDWLPELVLLADFGGNWQQYIDAVYSYFRQDFIDAQPSFDTKPCRVINRHLTKNKEETFWHIVTRDDHSPAPTGKGGNAISHTNNSSQRNVDIRGCEHIRWARPLIEAAARNDGNALWWRDMRQRDMRLFVAPTDFSYAVVMVERKNQLLLLTAFCAEWKHEQKRLRHQYEMGAK